MKILNLSLDKAILHPLSNTAKRAVTYGSLVDMYTILVPADSITTVQLSCHVVAYGVKGTTKLTTVKELYSRANQLLSKTIYTLITVQDAYYIGFAGMVLAKKYNLRFEVQIHGFEKLTWFRKRLARYVLSRADSVRCVSKRLKRELVNTFCVDEHIITIVPIYTEPPKERHHFKKEDDSLVVLTIGRLVPVKNIQLQIKAFNSISDKYPHAELWIVGTGKEEANLKAMSIHNNIKFLGHQSDLSLLYGEADIFLLTSNYEGWGLVVVEAAQYRLPIIMTDVGCAGEVIQHDKSGIVIPVGDGKALVSAIERLLSDSDLRTSLGNAAHEAVQFLPNEEQTLALYKKSWSI